MTDFLDGLEHELLGAARRRAETRWRDDIRAFGGGALLTMSVAVVVAVLVVIGGLAGRHRAPAASTPPRTSSPATAMVSTRSPAGGPCAGSTRSSPASAPVVLRPWLTAGTPATSRQRRAALTDLDRAAVPTMTVYERDVRLVAVPRLGRVLLVPARSCDSPGAGEPAARPRPVLIAEVPAHTTATATSDATVVLGGPAAIRGGAALHAPAILVRTGRGPTLVAAVPATVVRVVCRWTGGAVGSFAVVGHLVAIPEATAPSDCRLIAS